MKITEEMKVKYTDRLCFADSQLGMEAWVYYLDLLQPSPQPDTVLEESVTREDTGFQSCSLYDESTPSSSSILKQPPVDNDHVAEGCEQFSEETIALNKKSTTAGELRCAVDNIAPHIKRGGEKAFNVLRGLADSATTPAAVVTVSNFKFMLDDLCDRTEEIHKDDIVGLIKSFQNGLIITADHEKVKA